MGPRTNGVIIDQKIICSKEGFQAKKKVYKKGKIEAMKHIMRQG